MAHHSAQAAVIAGGFTSPRPDDDEVTASDEFDLKNFEKLPCRDVPINELSPGLHLRQGGTNAAHVQLLMDAATAAELPPILVQEDGWRVIDGLHRLEAAKLCGDQIIKARFIDCTDSEALVLAVKANILHGLPLSKADRVSGAKRVLTAHPDWADRAIASITGLSAKTIASLRIRVAGGALPGGKRIGRDGRRRPVAADEGRRRAAEYISSHPNAPLRQVARETDVSLGTAHDVRSQLRSGPAPDSSEHRLRAARPHVQAAARVTETLSVAPAGTGPSPRRTNHTDAPPTWAAVAAAVASDPAIRYTEGGKEFLQWMALHANDPGGWREFHQTIPAHWLSVIAPIADGISKEWSLFADLLRAKQESGR